MLAFNTRGFTPARGLVTWSPATKQNHGFALCCIALCARDQNEYVVRCGSRSATKLISKSNRSSVSLSISIMTACAPKAPPRKMQSKCCLFELTESIIERSQEALTFNCRYKMERMWCCRMVQLSYGFAISERPSSKNQQRQITNDHTCSRTRRLNQVSNL